jgi:hypothetical protein
VRLEGFSSNLETIQTETDYWMLLKFQQVNMYVMDWPVPPDQQDLKEQQGRKD